MAALQSLSPELFLHIAQLLQVSLKSLIATVELLDEGSTVPFTPRLPPVCPLFYPQIPP